MAIDRPHLASKPALGDITDYITVTNCSYLINPGFGGAHSKFYVSE